jgi:hypothetical protein
MDRESEEPDSTAKKNRDYNTIMKVLKALPLEEAIELADEIFDELMRTYDELMRTTEDVWQ